MTSFRLLLATSAAVFLAYFGLIIALVIMPDESDKFGGQFKNQRFVIVTETTPQRIRDLTQIAIALEDYKREHRRYPLSKSGDRDWSMRVTISGDPNPNWIEGLVPTYLDELPRDPRGDDVYTHQYAYKSDGVHYKLLAQYPEDCKLIKAVLPKMIAYNCAAYGYWSEKAVYW